LSTARAIKTVSLVKSFYTISMHYWLVKTEPEEYSFYDLLKAGNVVWDGVRNYQARNNLKAMKVEDKVLVYHSGEKKEIVGIAKVVKEHFFDPKDKTNTWVVVKLEPVKELKQPVTLNEIKSNKALSSMPLIKQSRLSVMPVTESEFNIIVKNQ